MNSVFYRIAGGGAIYAISSSISIDYCDFNANNGGNFNGILPGGLGILSGVNANGDSCDIYHNIFSDPLFVGANAGNYHLQAGSPCIDAGDPSSPLDPDSTVADIGALYFDQSSAPSLILTLTPHNPPIQIPASGGSFTFDASIVNTTQSPITFDAWTEAVLPRGNVYGPIILRTNLQIPAGAAIMRVLTQNVPGNAPAGNYTFVGNAGTHPGTVVDSDEFPFVKIAGDEIIFPGQGWTCWGWEESSEFNSTTPSLGFELMKVYPNPFNAETSINFALTEASMVKVCVYDVEGRLVTALVDGRLAPGSHHLRFTGAGMASGVYFCSFERGGVSQISKILLIK